MKNGRLTKENIVDFILDLFERRGAEEYMGEKVSLSQHMEQSAACASADGAPDALVVAALLHDVGHFVSDFPIDALENGIDNLHETAGADFLCAYFPLSVTEPIRNHVAAKKYLCSVDQDYIKCLSPASVNTLNVQGGPMTKTEVEDFEANPFHLQAVKARRYDDSGKVAGLQIKPIASYRPLMQSLISP